ncbi:MAG: hypothetical protein ABJM57_14650, partial [Lentilitoribacter sp.]
RINLSSGWVNSPTFLNPLKLPLKTRLAVCDHLEERARTLGLHGQYEGFVREVIGRLSSSGAKNGNKKIIDSFFRYTTELDHSRKQSFEHALPSLAKVVNPGSIQEAFESYDTPVSNEIKFPSNSFQTTDPAVEISTISNLEDQNGRLKRMLIEALLELDRQKR